MHFNYSNEKISQAKLKNIKLKVFGNNRINKSSYLTPSLNFKEKLLGLQVFSVFRHVYICCCSSPCRGAFQHR